MCETERKTGAVQNKETPGKTTPDRAIIRDAKLQDAAAIKECIDRAYAPIRTRLSDLPDVSAGIEDDIADKIVIVCEIDNKIAGCAILGIDGASAHLVNIAVDPDFKGQGMGKKLLLEIEDRARRKGAVEIHLATHANMSENVALYTHFGWSEASRYSNKILMKKAF